MVEDAYEYLDEREFEGRDATEIDKPRFIICFLRAIGFADDDQDVRATHSQPSPCAPQQPCKAQRRRQSVLPSSVAVGSLTAVLRTSPGCAGGRTGGHDYGRPGRVRAER